jgi:hypothetical protein
MFMVSCFPLLLDYEGVGKNNACEQREQNRDRHAWQQSIFNDSPVLHGSRNERNRAIYPSIHHHQDISAAGSVSGYTGRGVSGRQGRTSSYHDRLASVAERLPVENVGVIACAVGEAVF